MPARTTVFRDELDFVERIGPMLAARTSIVQIAAITGIDRGTLSRWIAKARKAGHHLTAPVGGQIERVDQMELAHKELTREEAIDLLHKVQAENPAKWITSRAFAHMTGLRDTSWQAHFGTFEEFCRQAGLGRRRQNSMLGKQAARHVAHDHYRDVGADRTCWGEDYKRDSGGRFKTVLCASDLHDREMDPFVLRVLIDTACRAQPDVISLVGDVFDLPEFGKYTVDPRTWDAVGRIRFVHDQILRPLREACPDAQIDLIEGNHEHRLVRHTLDANPAMMSLLSDLHGWDVRKLFGLDEFEVNYVAQGSLAAHGPAGIRREVDRNWRVYWDAFLVHHFPHGRNKGLPGCNGHHHKHALWVGCNPITGPYEWHQMGCGHRRSASYCDGEQWHNGFLLAHVDTSTKAVASDYVQILDHACVGGRFYHRQEDER
jgi:hypothetical protein